MITLLYKSFKSDVANLPPSNWTIGLKSGGITGITFITIHLGSFPDFLKDSTTSNLLIILTFFWPLLVFNSSFNSLEVVSKSISPRISWTASAPIPATKLSSPNLSTASLYSFSLKSCFFKSEVSLGSITTYEAKYKTFSKALGDVSKSNPILEGIPLKYQMWDTGAANSMCPILSLLTLAFVTSTPHLSQTIPLYLTLLYLPQWHSQSFIGPNILSQNRPSLSGFKVL